MKAEFVVSHLGGLDCGTVCVLNMQDEEPPSGIAHFLKGVKKERYEGKLLQTYSCDCGGRLPFRHLVVVGMGKKDEARLDNLRRAAGLAVRLASARKEKEICLFVPEGFHIPEGADHAKAVQAITEGAILSAYKFTEFKTKKEDIFEVERFRIAGAIGHEDALEGIATGTIMAESQNYSRKLDDQPGNIATPQRHSRGWRAGAGKGQRSWMSRSSRPAIEKDGHERHPGRGPGKRERAGP